MIRSSFPNSQKQLLEQMNRPSRLTLYHIMRRAHDLFASETRNKAGFSAKAPEIWQKYIVYRYRLNNEILLHLWNLIKSINTDTISSLSSSSTSSKQYTILKDRIQRVYKELENQYEDLDKLKEQVTQKGIKEVIPPLPNNMKHTTNENNETIITINDEPTIDSNEGRSEIIKLLMLLQKYLEPALLSAHSYKV